MTWGLVHGQVQAGRPLHTSLRNRDEGQMEKTGLHRPVFECGISRIPFFFKQWGGIWKSRHGRRLEGRIYDERPKASAYPLMSRTERLAYAAGIERMSRVGLSTKLPSLLPHQGRGFPLRA